MNIEYSSNMECDLSPSQLQVELHFVHIHFIQ